MSKLIKEYIFEVLQQEQDPSSFEEAYKEALKRQEKEKEENLERLKKKNNEDELQKFIDLMTK